MPNWCHNVLTVTGPEAEIASFAEKARPTPALKRREYEDSLHLPEVAAQSLEEWFAKHYGRQPLTFEAFAPQPDDREWRSWREEAWGTKWDAEFGDPGPALTAPEGDVEASLDANGLVATPTVLVYRFETAWSPPTEAVAVMAEQHPALAFRLRYGEPGADYAGEATFSDGDLQDDVGLDVDEVLAPEEMWH
jgi:hypothetical protein